MENNNAPERVWLPTDTDADTWNILAKNTTRDWRTGEPITNIEYVRADLVNASAEPTCAECGHRGLLVNGTCRGPAPDISAKPYCLCECKFPSAEVVKGEVEEWCDDCHGYTHRPDCPVLSRKPKPIEEQFVDAVYRSMCQYDDGTWFLDDLRAQARVTKILKPLVAERDALLSRIEQQIEALKGVSIMLSTALMRYEEEPWAQRVRAALKDSK